LPCSLNELIEHGIDADVRRRCILHQKSYLGAAGILSFGLLKVDEAMLFARLACEGQSA